LFRLKKWQIEYITGQNTLKNDQKWAKNGQNRVIFADFHEKRLKKSKKGQKRLKKADFY
jgi:hypothetical protein